MENKNLRNKKQDDIKRNKKDIELAEEFNLESDNAIAGLKTKKLVEVGESILAKNNSKSKRSK